MDTLVFARRVSQDVIARTVHTTRLSHFRSTTFRGIEFTLPLLDHRKPLDALYAYNDDKLLEHRIGSTIVARPTNDFGDLSCKEICKGVAIFTKKIRKFKQTIVLFKGKGTFTMCATMFVWDL
jgi:hypothetical protein